LRPAMVLANGADAGRVVRISGTARFAYEQCLAFAESERLG
jgi:hypothetical protein